MVELLASFSPDIVLAAQKHESRLSWTVIVFFVPLLIKLDELPIIFSLGLLKLISIALAININNFP